MVVAMSLVAGTLSVASAADEKKPNPQKCNADASAKSLKSDDRKAFMSSCLKG